jgi:unconventional prefoldin RPB5 interactor 1
LQAVDEQASEIARLRRVRAEYEQLRVTLNELVARVEHQVMIPLCKNAFMPGRLKHTNEILVLLGDNIFAERSSSQAAKIAARRVNLVEEKLVSSERELARLERRHEQALEIHRVAAEQARDEVVDIREPYESDGEAEAEGLDGGAWVAPGSASDAARAKSPGDAGMATRADRRQPEPQQEPPSAGEPAAPARPKPVSKFKAERMRAREAS